MNHFKFPPPYPDELVYSVIARFLQSYGYLDPRSTLKNAGIAVSRYIWPEVSSDLHSVANAIGVPRLTPLRLAQDHTLLPYLLPFEKQRSREQIVSFLTSDTPTRYINIKALPPSRIGRPTHFRFCPACNAESIGRHGEIYWRRSHQIPGAIICSTHGTRLYRSGIPFSSQDHAGYRAAHESNCRVAKVHLEDWVISPNVSQYLANRSAALLDKKLGRPADIERRTLGRLLNQICRQRSSSGDIQTRFDDMFLAFLGKDRNRFTTSDYLGRPWWYHAYHATTTKLSSFQHLLIRTFACTEFPTFQYGNFDLELSYMEKQQHDSIGSHFPS